MTSFLTTGGIRGGKSTLTSYQPRGFNMGMSAELFRSVGGYDENFVCGEDVELSLRLQKAGAISRFIPEAHVYHKRRATLKQFRRQVFRFGAARPLLAKAHPGNLKADPPLPVGLHPLPPPHGHSCCTGHRLFPREPVRFAVRTICALHDCGLY